MKTKVQNLTLAIDDHVLLEARKIALDLGTSVNQMVREYLVDLVEGSSRRRAARDRLKRSMHEQRVVIGPKTWTREMLHER